MRIFDRYNKQLVGIRHLNKDNLSSLKKETPQQLKDLRRENGQLVIEREEEASALLRPFVVKARP